MPIVFKSTLSSSVANDTFLDKTIDDKSIGVISLENVTNVDSGSFIANAQRYINELADSDGTLGEGDATRKDYANENYIADGDSRKTAIEKLDAQALLNQTQSDTNTTDIGTNASDIQAINDAKGVANGFAELDGGGQVPVAQIPQEAFDGLSPKGNWDADTNTPDLSALAPNIGDYYLVNVAGSTSLGGITTWEIGDWAVFTDAGWIRNVASEVTSVNSQKGAVVLDADDIAETATRYWDIKNNDTAAVDPIITDDSSLNYSVGSVWFNALTGKKFTLQDSTIGAAVWIETGGTGSGDGSFNNITNSKAQDDTTGWTVYANTTAANKPDDFGGTPNVGFTWTRNETTPLIGVADFLLTKPALDTQGSGIYFEFTAEKAHLATMNLFSMFNDTTNLNDSDVSVWLVSSDDSFASDFNIISSSVPDILTGNPRTFKQFQFNAIDTEYRLCLHWNSTDTDAKTAYFDDIFLGPKEVATSAVVTDFKEDSLVIDAVTTAPTLGTTVINNFQTKQVGDCLEGIYQIEWTTAGTAGSGTYLFPLPSGLKIDTAKIKNIANPGTSVGSGSITIAAVGNFDVEVLIHDESNLKIYINQTYDVVSSSSAQLSNATGGYSFNFSVPIQGWSSNAVTSEDLGGREIAASYGGVTPVAGAAIPYVLKFNNKTIDTTSSYNPLTGEYTVGESGLYDGNLLTAYSYTGNALTPTLLINGIRKFFGNASNSSVTDYNKLFLNFEALPLNKGDIVTFRVDSWSGAGVITNVGTADDEHYFSIAKRASPQTILDTATVAMRYTSSSGLSVAYLDPFSFENLDYDSHNIFSSNTTATIPKFSLYCISATLRSQTASFLDVSISVNGSRVLKVNSSSSSAFVTTQVNEYLRLDKGDLIQVYNDSGGGGSMAQTPDDQFFTLSITEVN